MTLRPLVAVAALTLFACVAAAACAPPPRVQLIPPVRVTAPATARP